MLLELKATVYLNVYLRNGEPEEIAIDKVNESVKFNVTDNQIEIVSDDSNVEIDYIGSIRSDVDCVDE